MKIIVCIKQVPAKDSNYRVNETSNWIREADMSFEVNEPDSYALEAALQLKEKNGGEVVVCSVGPARVQPILREALARGADRAIHVEVESTSLQDSFETASLIAAAIREEKPDLVCSGLQSDDLGLGQTGVILAELLGIPHSTIIMDIQLIEGRLKVKRELEGGYFQWLEMPIPALLTIQSGINKLRYATLKGIKLAKTKEIRRITPGDLSVKAGDFAGQKVHRIYVPVQTKKTEIIEGSPKDASAALIQKLKQEARVL